MARTSRKLPALAIALAAASALASVRPARAQSAQACVVDDVATRSRAAAFDATNPSDGVDAVQTYLEALHALGAKQPACFDVMEADVPKLRALYCGAESKYRTGETCVLLEKIQIDIARLEAQRLVEAGDKSEGDAAVPLFEKGARAYLGAYQTYCLEPVARAGPVHVAPTACDEIAYNAARAFRAAHDAPQAMAAYRLLIAEDQRTKRSSPLAAKALFELAAMHQAGASFGEAAEHYERFATLYPRSNEAPRALSDAAILRLALRQDEQASRDAAAFTKNWGITRRPQAAQLALTVAADQAARDQKDKARAVLAASMAMLDRGPVDLTVRAHAIAARVAPTPAIAKLEWAKVRDAWKDPAQAELAIRRGWPGEEDAQLDRRVARVLNDVGEALFAAAEEKRIAEIKKTRLAIERLEPEYVKILELRPVPPPRWVVAAGAAVANMWGELGDARIAKPAMKKCIDLSVKYMFADPRVRACEVWLASHAKTEFHLVDEIVPAYREEDASSLTADLRSAGRPLRAPLPPPGR